MQFIYEDMPSASGQFVAHSEIDDRGATKIYVLQLINCLSGAVVHQEQFSNWNSYSQRVDMLRTVVLPMK
jgi:hypothetical protein